MSMSFKTITILGAKGMLGTDLTKAAAGRGWGVCAYDLPETDITNEEQIRQIVSSSRVIVNCAAYTNVEKAETEYELARKVNGHAAGMLGRTAKTFGVPVLHISTDFVFDGLKPGAYVETDAIGPLSAYGRSKALGEELLAQSGCEYSIVRIQWTYGRHGNHFITKILNAAEKQPSLKVVDDQVGSPTHTLEVAEAICRMLELGAFPTGLYHMAAREYVSRYEMARTLFKMLGKSTDVIPCKTSDFKSAAARPLNSCFDCTKLETLLGRPFKTWQVMLKEYLESL